MRHNGWSLPGASLVTFAVIFLFSAVCNVQAAPMACTGVKGPHSGYISADQVWCASDNPHIINGDLTINTSGSLTLEKGVLVQFDPGIRLLVNGTLNATGDAGNWITFTSNATSPAPGDWGAIYFQPNSHGNLAYAKLWYGGGSYSGDYAILSIHAQDVTVDHSDIGWSNHSGINSTNYPTISQNTIHNIHDYGIIFMDPPDGSTLTLTNNTFSNTGWAAWVKWGGFYAGGSVLLAGNSSSGAGYNGFGIESASNQAAVTYSSDSSFPIILKDVSVSSSGSLSIAPGTVIKFYDNTQHLNVSGALKAPGSAGQPIIFTSIKDDKHGGDTNGDGAISSPAAGDWMSISLNASSHDNVFSHAWIGYGGSGENAELTAGNGHFSLSDSTIANSASAGLRKDTNSDSTAPTISRNVFSQNSQAGIYLWGLDDNMPLNVVDNTFLNNTQAAIWLNCGANPYMGSDVHLTGNYSSGSQHNGLYIEWINYNQAVTYTSTPNFPFIFDQIEILASGSLTLSTGTIVKFVPGGYLSVLGSLNAVGTASQPVVFTSLKDDSHGGDTNGDGNSSQPAPGDWRHIYLRDTSKNNVIMHAWIGYGGGGEAETLLVTTSTTRLEESVISHSAAHGLHLAGPISVTFQNLALMDNANAGIANDWGVTSITLLHLTLARNLGSGIYCPGNNYYGLTTVHLINTIIADNTTGVLQVQQCNLNLDHTLWDGNTTNTAGTVTQINSLTGQAGFAPDGFHITQNSDALAAGITSGAAIDIDEEGRPISHPDLGADQFLFAPAKEKTFDKFAFPPYWWMTKDGSSGNMLFHLEQDYLIRFFYGSSDAAANPITSYVINDILPAGLTFVGEEHTMPMNFGRSGNSLTWTAISALAPMQAATVKIRTQSDTVVPGTVLENQASLFATLPVGGTYNPSTQASSVVPLMEPRITFPGDGEVCLVGASELEVRGVAQPGMIVKIFENGVQVDQVTVAGNGNFSSYFVSSLASHPVDITAQACRPDQSGCSAVTYPPRHIEIGNSFWDPQRSSWTGTRDLGGVLESLVFNFRDATGKFSTTNWQIPGYYGFWDTTLVLYACPYDGIMPIKLKVNADNQDYNPIINNNPTYEFHIHTAHTVLFMAEWPVGSPPAGGWPPASPGEILIDPDGYVFDGTLGFNPASPTDHSLAGATVTAWEYQPGSGAWARWPAELYNNQKNPQVTASDGYFSFLTPPGQYYLSVEGPAGFQAWRSPVVTVVNKPVHVNVPLTPVQASKDFTITLGQNGLDHPYLSIPKGSTVEWVVDPSGYNAEQLFLMTDTPQARLLSSPGPLVTSSGWDSGRLVPGQSYRKRFTQEGIYYYQDSLGHTGIIIVPELKIFLPFVKK